MTIDIDPLEFAALVASRVCHDIISPVGAINNGLEVLEEEKDEGMREFAMDLVQKSAAQTSAKLQFARLAFGASGGAGAELDMADAGRVAAGYLEREKATLDWQVTAVTLPKAKAKLLLNLVMLGAQAIARGGTLTVTADTDGTTTLMRLVAEGDRARFPVAAKGVLIDGELPDPLDAHAIQPVLTAMLARQAEMAVSIDEKENRVTIGVAPRSAAEFAAA